MDVALPARLILAAVLALAAASKVADRDATRAAMAGFGVPQRLAGAAGIAVAAAELAVAVALVPVASARAAGVAALGMLVVFSAMLALRLARGERPDCRCFGRLSAKPASWWALARNAALAVLAVTALAAGPGGSATAWIGDLSVAGRVALGGGVLLAAVVAVASALVLALLRRHGRALLRIEELERGRAVAPSPDRDREPLPPGAPAPAFELPDADGLPVSLDDLTRRGRPVLLVFSDNHCAACDSLLPHVARWQSEHADELTIAVVADGDPEEVRAKREGFALEDLVIEGPDHSVSSAYRVAATPAGVLVGADGRVGAAAMGAADIATLLEQAVGVPAPGPGEPAPVAELPGADGDPVDLVPGAPALLVFWDPGCPACDESLARDIRAWEGELPLALRVVSRGSAGANAALAADATVALDDGDFVTRAFGVEGTPAAVLLDADGTIASPVAEGPSAIRVLAAMSRPSLEGARA